MSVNDLAGLSLLTGAAVFGYRAYQNYKGQGGAVALAPAPQPVAPNAFAPLDTGWLSAIGGLFDWPDYVPEVVAAVPGLEGLAPLFSGSIDDAPGSLSFDELTLARTIYGEAANESLSGKEAVAAVIMNRQRSARWPNGIAAVCQQPWQFSCWNANDPQRARIENRQPGSNRQFDECVKVAVRAARGRLADPTGGATHYYANYIAQPSWIKNSPNARQSAQFGVHKFYTGIA